MSGASDPRHLLRGLVSDALEGDDLAERWARVRWSTLVEPGDGIAGRLIAAFGARAALALVHTDETIAVEDVSATDLHRARARWRLRGEDEAYPIELARRVGARVIAPGDPEWPARLDDLGPFAPVCLWARGDRAVLASDRPAVAVVGARASTAYGERAAAEIVGDLAQGGVDIVSGAAVGIDAAAHRATLAVGGRGIAVLAGGVEKAYPSGHAALLASLAASGVVVSEVPCGTAPTKWRFLQRNRVIAALADATIVVEAGWRSGSLNTAGHAAALGRPLGAVPGPITSAASAGCHRVLREYDGCCVTCADDVRELLGLTSGPDAGGPGAPGARGGGEGTGDATRVLDALTARAPRPLDDIARRAGLTRDEAATLLGLLQLEGRVSRDSAGWRRV